MKNEVSDNGHSSFLPPTSPLLFILSGPSGVGKDAVLNSLKASDCPLKYITTTTTRARRAGEINGKDYYFVPLDAFKKMIAANELLECAEVYGNWYGVPKEEVRKAFKEGSDVMLKVDIQGVANIRKIAPQAVTIFLMPSSMEELEARLRSRHTETAFDLARRLKTAETEMRQCTDFDYVVLNREGEIKRAISDIQAIITAEKRRSKPREITL
jgi:guanylate kinase